MRLVEPGNETSPHPVLFLFFLLFFFDCVVAVPRYTS